MINTIDKKYDQTHNKKLEFIDSLRGIASLTVIVFHLVFIPQPKLPVPGTLDKFIHVGGSGVILFFVISAFTLYMSADNRQQETRKTIKFYLRRLFRIAPLFYFMLCFHLLVSYFIFNNKFSWKVILLNLTFTYNFSPPQVESIVWAGWTIGIEMLFYILMPFILLKINTLQKSILFFALTVFIADVYNSFVKYNFHFKQDVVNKYLYMNFINHLPTFTVGIICFFVYKRLVTNIQPVNREKISYLLLSLFTILFLGIVNKKVNFLIPVVYWQALSFALLLISFSILPNQLFVNKITAFYGKISYSTYLVHPFLIFSLTPIYRYIYKITPFLISVNFILCIALTIVILTPLSLITYYLIENPGIRWGKKIIAML